MMIAAASFSASAFASVITLASGDVISLTTSTGPVTVQCQAAPASGGSAGAVYCQCDEDGMNITLNLYQNGGSSKTALANYFSLSASGPRCKDEGFVPGGKYYHTCGFN